jgi:hypothetical protein
MGGNSEDKIQDRLESQIRRYGLIKQTRIQEDQVDTNLSMNELAEITDGILKEEDIPEEGAERYSYFTSVLRIMVGESFETGMSCLCGVLGMSLASIGSEILEHEDIDRYERVVDMIEGFSDEQLELAFEYASEFRETDQGIAATQNHVQLSEMADPISEIEVDDSGSAQKSVEIYSKCMDLCDNASTLLLALNRIDEGENPFDVDLAGMNYGAKLNQLSDSKCETLVEGIDKDLRNAISHGDIVVDPYEKEVYDASTEKRYSFEELEDKTKTCVSVSKFMGSVGLIVTAKWAYSLNLS